MSRERDLEQEPAAAAAEIVDALRQTRLWHGVPDSVARQVAELMEPLRFETNETLILQGQEGTHFYLLTAGSVDVRIGGIDSASATVATLGPNECVGEMSLLTGNAASASVVATERVEALALDAAEFRTTVANDPKTLHEFVRILSERLQSTGETVGTAREKEAELTQFLGDPRDWDTDVIGKSKQIRVVRQRIAAVADSLSPIAVLGEVGTGKELVARLVHVKSARAEQIVIAVGCDGIAESQWGDKLFGVRGARDVRAPGLSFTDLAEGGTLVLKLIEHLPIAVQQRLVRFLSAQRKCASSVRQNVRVIVTSEGELEELAVAGHVLPDLADLLIPGVIQVPPLRERKRDINELAPHYIAKHAKRLDKDVHRIDDEALIKLVSYDFRLSNVRELEQAIERAVILASSESITADEIFVGAPPPERAGGLNLLRIPGIDVKRWLPLLLRVGRIGTALGLLSVLLLAFFGPSDPDVNPAAQLVWLVGWPLLALSFITAGRLCCAICPMSFAASVAKRSRDSKRRIPQWLKKHDVWVAMSGLFVIMLLEETTGMRHSPLLTGFLLLGILTGAVATGLLFPRRTWCRHICPMGAMAGVCATSGLLELRPTLDVCSAKCKGHMCFKGNEHVAGCPMFNHVMFLDTNQHCVLCMNCVLSCPNDSPQLNLRVPGRELADDAAAQPGLGKFVLMLSGMLAAMTIVQHLDHIATDRLAALLTEQRFWFVGSILALGCSLPLFLGVRRGIACDAMGEESAARHWRRVVALAPTVAAGLVAFQLTYAPGLAWLNATLTYNSGLDAESISVPLLSLLQVGVMTGGLGITTILASRCSRRGKDLSWIRRLQRERVLLVGAALYWAVLLGMMLAA